MTGNGWALRSGRRLERRFFLKALALGCSVPMAWKLSSLAIAQPAARPKRFMLFYMPHGVPPEHFNPKVNPNNPAEFSLNESGVSILGPLQEKYKSLVNVHQGFYYPTGTGKSITHEGILSFLSGVDAFSSDSLDETRPRTTLEHAIAKGLGVKPLVLGAVAKRPYQFDKDSKLMWDGQYVVPEKNPIKAYDTAFAGIGAAPMTGPDPDVELRAALSTFTEREIGQLNAELAGLTREQSKLAIHLEGVQALKAGSGSTVVSCTTRPTIASVESLRAKSAGQPTEEGNDFFLKNENFPDILAAQLGVAAQALLCNVTSVVAVQSLYANCDIDFGFMGSSGPHHSALSHTGPSQIGTTLDPVARTPFAKAQRWFVEQLTQHVLTVLDQPDPADPAHKVIDNTIIYLCSEIGEGADHTSQTRVIQRGAEPATPTSYVVSASIGGGGGALKTGQVLTFAQDRHVGDIYLALSRAMGVPDATFGTASTPLTEILA